MQCCSLQASKHQLRLVSLHWRHNGRDSVSNHQPHDCLLNRLCRRRSKKTSKLRVTGLCVGNSPGTGEFPAQRASNAENVCICWRHHVIGTTYHYTATIFEQLHHRLVCAKFLNAEVIRVVHDDCPLMSTSWLCHVAAVLWHYTDVIMSAMASQITGSGADLRKHQNSPYGPLWGESTDHRWFTLTKGK